MNPKAIDYARSLIERNELPEHDPSMVLARAIVQEGAEPGCKGAPRDMPKGPWNAVKVALDSPLLFRLIHGETVIVDHRALPPDASLMAVRQNGTEVVLIIGSQTYQSQTCLCSMPTLRINYSTGG